MRTTPENFLDSDICLSAHQLSIINIPFREPVHLPFGTIESRPSAWLTVSGEVEGEYGIGASEGTALPMQIPMYDDYSGNLQENIEQLLLPLYDKHLSINEARQLIATADLGGNYATARMTVETCLLDLSARTKGTTVYEVFSSDTLEAPIEIPYGKSIAEIDVKKICAAGLGAIQRGAKRLKFKLSPANFSAVVEGISKLQSEHRSAEYMVDANGSFDPENTNDINMLKVIDNLGLLMIEEPVSRKGRSSGLMAHRILRDAMQFRTSIALDDSISTKEDAYAAMEEGLGEIINLKPGRIGSFLDCVEIADVAKQRKKQIMVGGMFEATPGRTMTLTLAALCLKNGFMIPGDVSLPQERLAGDLTEANLRLDDNYNVIFQPKEGWGYIL